MTSKLTREENVQAVFDLKAGYTLGLADVEILKRVARMALAAMDSEPVGEVIEVGDALLVEWHKNLEEGAKLYTTPQAPVIPFGLHLDTQKLVTDFCTALAEKLYKAQLKYGYDADWKQDGWPSQCQAHFHQHITKGDPRDVAAYCAFMWYHGWKTEAAQPALVVSDEVQHVAAVLELIGSFEAADIDSDTVDLRFEIDDVDTGSDVSISEYAARGAAIIRMLAGMLQAAPLTNEGDIALHNYRTALEGIGHIRRTLEETFGGLHGTHVEPDVLMECKTICDAIYAAYRGSAQGVPKEKLMPNSLSMYAVDAVAAIAEVRGWNACRAAMLQESQKSAGVSNNCRSGENVQDLQAGNSPVIPDGWIPVSERMPETDGNYWGWWSESKRQGPVWFIKSELQAQFQSHEITHWMPLPEAPQEVKK